MKHLIFIIVFINLNTFAQSKFITKTGLVSFEASVPSFEEVKAKNKTATAILNTETGEFASLVLIKGFRFKNALMEEHFNENYAESDKFPKATFKGTIKDFSLSSLKSKNTYKLSGELFFHGKTKKIDAIEVTLVEDNGGIKISGNFKVKSSEFDIKIPKIVKNKISEQVDVLFGFYLQQ